MARVLRGIGDDAAVVRARAVCVTSVDAMVEGVHFRLGEGWATPAEVGHRALAGALSDLAAMGADAGRGLLVLGLPAGFSEERALELVRGARRARRAHRHGDRRRRRRRRTRADGVGHRRRLGREPRRARRPRRRAPGRSRRRHRPAGRRRRRAGRDGGTGRRTPAREAALARARSPMPRLAEGRALARGGRRTR